jgi:hypothetical protein
LRMHQLSSTTHPSPTAIAQSGVHLMSEEHTPPFPVQRLNRVQQLTLNTWRLAAAKLDRVLDPYAILEHAAVHATHGALRDVHEPLALFRRHAEANPEFALIISLISATGHEDLAYDILDTAFLLRWNELVADGNGPKELPPLRPRPATGDQPAERR